MVVRYQKRRVLSLGRMQRDEGEEEGCSHLSEMGNVARKISPSTMDGIAVRGLFLEPIFFFLRQYEHLPAVSSRL